MKKLFFLLLSFILTSCGQASMVYYNNINPQRSNQQAFNIDSTQCEALAQQAKARVQIPLYNYGFGDQLLQQTVLLNQLSQADKLYSTTKEACLSRLGWYRISESEYKQLQNR